MVGFLIDARDVPEYILDCALSNVYIGAFYGT